MSKPIILCIDDEPSVLDSLRRELTDLFEERCEIETALGGEDALNLQEDFLEEGSELALVISDYIMPDMKGDEILAHIHQSFPKTLAIMLTGHATLEGITNAINTAGLYRFIPKPWNSADLQLTVREALNSYWAEQQLVEYRQELEQKVEERTEKLRQTLHELELTQAELVRTEKLASLGELVAGVAHEINTPVGNAILAASVLEQETHGFKQSFESGAIKKSHLTHYLDVASNSSQLVFNNLQRAADIIQNFKQVAIDRTNLESRVFKVVDYLESIAVSLEPQWKKAKHHLIVEGDRDIVMEGCPGVLSQVVTNLVMNSIVHAYDPGQRGHLMLQVARECDRIHLSYSDDGRGMTPDLQERIFDPFFTTARDRGGSGLGLNIVHNIVTQSLQGNLRCKSVLGQGTTFVLDLPQHPANL
ncbi:MAG: sensor histidine kinase [Synechococcus sp.]